MQNFFGYAASIRSQGTYYNPFGSAAIGYIDTRDIGEVVAKVRWYNLNGPKAITDVDVAEQLTLAAGKKVTSTPVTLEQIRQVLIGHGLPDIVADASAELFGLMAAGFANTISPDVERLLGRPPRDFAQFASDFGATFGSALNVARAKQVEEEAAGTLRPIQWLHVVKE